jgi:SAM-dependent methyltransferase
MLTWDTFHDQYRSGRWRAALVHDLILADVWARGPKPTVLDIGCGRGFDDDPRLQASLASHAGRYVGVEPDTEAPLGNCFDAVYRCPLEDAAVAPGSVHVAFAVMVLEHLRRPQTFFDKIHTLLADGGVFWALTMDARHWFCTASQTAGRLGIKDLYLGWIWGRRGCERYANYPAFYRANTPGRIRQLARGFRDVRCANLAREGQLDPYLPRALRPLGRFLDRRAIGSGRPGPLLAVRLEK